MSTEDVKRMRLRRDGACACGVTVSAGTLAGWDRVRRTVVCPNCLDGSAVSATIPTPRQAGVDGDRVVASGLAGASAQAEYERRKARREERVRAAHPRIGGLLLAVTNEPQSTLAWASGAAGERHVAERLAELVGEEALLLNDRRMARSTANIDHVAVGPAGVYVIDAKHYDGAKVEILRSGGLFRPVVEQLRVAGRDRTNLLAGLRRQVAAVEAALASLDSSVQVGSMLCFVGAVFPMFGSLQLDGVDIVGPKGAAKIVRQPGPLDAAARERIHAHLAARLRPATRT